MVLAIRRITVLLFWCLLASFAYSQENISRVALWTDSLSKKQPQQLVYLQLSKGVYETGEDLWFKGYIMNARYNEPSAADTTLYIQLRHALSNQLIRQEKILIHNGFADGHLIIREDVSPGDYILMAFTAGSFLNDQEEFKAFRKLRIMKRINPKLAVNASVKRINTEDKKEIELTVGTSSNKLPVKGADVLASIFVDRIYQKTIQAVTGADGYATLKFRIDDPFKNTFLDIKTSYQKEDISNTITLPAIANDNFSVKFFPEGGHLVAEQVNVVAFKVSKQYGKPYDLNGILLENGKPIDSIKSTYGGMGKFNFVPRTGKVYAVKMGHSEILQQLPEIHKTGIVLKVLRQNEKAVVFLVTKSNSIPDQDIIISAQVRGTVYALYKGEMRNDTLLFNLPKDKFPQGIVEVTLYNSAMIPLVERLVYVNFDQKINISVEPSQSVYDRKDKVVLNIRASNEKGEPVIAHLGLSVYDDLYKNQEDFLNIISYTQLYSQIRGEIINPDYFFDENNKNRAQSMDLLLMTQGWRKYIWGKYDLLKTTKGQKIISDQVEGTMSGKSGLPKMLLAFTPEKMGFGDPIQISSPGKFKISKEQMLLANQGYFYIKPLGSDEIVKKTKIVLSDPFGAIDSILGQKKVVYPLIARKDKTDTLKVLPNIPGLITLDEVVIKGRGTGAVNLQRDKYMAKLDSTARFSGNSDFVGTCGWLNCGSCGSGSKPVEGVAYTQYKDGRVPWHGSFKNSDVIKKAYEYPKYTDEDLLKMFNMHRVQGYVAGKVFYSPDYERKPEEKNIFDFRNTLIWNPEVITNEKGEAKITFYCSDISGKFIGNIEGLDVTGRLGQVNFNLMVKDGKEIK
jgi:hypothetical protein